jgi:hypothetical protein
MTASWMHWLRSVALRRWVLACFMLAVGAATASPLVHPQNMQLLCTANGVVKLVAVAGASSVVSDGTSGGTSDQSLGSVADAHKLDCALCLPGMATPAALPHLPISNDALAQALRPLVQARLASLTAPPLPARGPPIGFIPILKQ